jgi:hypothetical protein
MLSWKGDKMETNTMVLVVLTAVVMLVIGGLLGVVFSRRQRTKNLRKQFGTEYERMVDEVGDQRQAEDELQARVAHVRSLDIQPLSEEQAGRFAHEWRLTQAKFVDEPVAAIQEADRLIKKVMSAKGYPVEDFDQRAADISVDYPDLVVHYRGMRDIAIRSEDEEVSTEEMRQAMVHSRALFEELLGAEVSEHKMQKEKM